jgi:hypothetical protein
MRATPFILACAVAAALTATAFALTVEREITADYVRKQPDEFSVRVTKGKTGLIEFTIIHNVATPMYHVAHLAVYHGGTLIATSDTPSFGKKRNNLFHFSIAPEAIAESRFSLSQSALSSSDDNAVPIPGTIVHHFRLTEFVSKDLMPK